MPDRLFSALNDQSYNIKKKDLLTLGKILKIDQKGFILLALGLKANEDLSTIAYYIKGIIP